MGEPTKMQQRNSLPAEVEQAIAAGERVRFVIGHDEPGAWLIGDGDDRRVPHDYVATAYE